MRRVLLTATLVLGGACLGGGDAFAQAPAAPGAWTAADCEACHDKATGPAFAHTKHATVAQSCAACHPNVAEHYKAKAAGDATGPSPSLKGMSANDLNVSCLKCHEKASQSTYLASMHSRRAVACTACHSVHDYKSQTAQLKTKSDTESCYSCHKDQRARSMRTSHHPVREGKMSCASCHNPHDGSREKMIKADSINELCYTCHAEKRGPFAFEHAPVREDCVSCHEPHGTNHPRLLAQKLPNLCWNCHLSGSGHFGSGDNFSTEKGVPIAPAGAPSGYPTINTRFIERSCRMCHVKIHGSNHPSGAFLVR